MELQRLVLAADSEMVNRIAQYTHMNCTVLNGATSFEDGTAIIIVRANSPRSVAKGTAAIRNASACQVPVIVVAGFDDDIGKEYLNEARKCGVPGECILLIKDGTVVDATGNSLGKPLRNTAIGVKTALAVAKRSLKDNLVPDISIWDGSEAPEEEVEPPVAAKVGNDAEATVAPAEPAAPAPSSPAHPVFPWYGFIEQAKSVVAVFGVKSGVGASMVAACLTGRMTEQSSLYLEVGPNASGSSYYGRSPTEAAQTGKYCLLRQGRTDRQPEIRAGAGCRRLLPRSPGPGLPEGHLRGGGHRRLYPRV